jgi:hypothetical protein
MCRYFDVIRIFFLYSEIWWQTLETKHGSGDTPGRHQQLATSSCLWVGTLTITARARTESRTKTDFSTPACNGSPQCNVCHVLVVLRYFSGRRSQWWINVRVSMCVCTCEEDWTCDPPAAVCLGCPYATQLTIMYEREIACFFFKQRSNHVTYYVQVRLFLLRPHLDVIQIPSFFTLSPSHQFLAACMEY